MEPKEVNTTPLPDVGVQQAADREEENSNWERVCAFVITTGLEFCTMMLGHALCYLSVSNKPTASFKWQDEKKESFERGRKNNGGF